MTEKSLQGRAEKEPGPRTWVWRRPWSRWRSARLLLLVLWMVAGLAWSFTKLSGPLLVFELMSAVVFPVLLWPWIRGPYLLYMRGWLPLHAGYQVQLKNIEALDFEPDATRLGRLGFEFAGVVGKDAVLDRPAVQVAIHAHPENKDSAQIACIKSRFGETRVLVFKTRFEDGFAFETANLHGAPVFPADPQYPTFRFSQIRSRTDLYRIHQKLKERFIVARCTNVAGNEEELAEFIARAEKVHQRQATDYKLNATGDRYVFTVRGAIRRAWLRTWPVWVFRELAIQRTASRTAAEFGLRINPKLGSLEDPKTRANER